MKRFYKGVSVAAVSTGSRWEVQLDGRAVKTQGGAPQCLPGKEMAEALAEEWRAQGEIIDPTSFRLRDMVDYALDVVTHDKGAVVSKLLGFADTDTLCYRADPEEALYRRQQEMWEPLLIAIEMREGVSFNRISGVVHKAQPDETLLRLRKRLEVLGPFELAALEQLTSLTASLCVGIEAMEDNADGIVLWDAANLEEDWQVALWGRDEETETRRTRRKGDFLAAMEFVRIARKM